MQLGVIPKAISFLAGLTFGAVSASFFLIAAIGRFDQGKHAAILGGVGFAVAALPPLVLPFSLKWAKVLLALFLLAFSALMLIAAFNPPETVTRPATYQAAAIAFTVLVLFRVVLPWRRKSAPVRT